MPDVSALGRPCDVVSTLGLSCHLPAIYLVGPMGAGKTTMGRLLAEELNRPFMDCDHHIVAQTGADIPWIFDKEGEAGFRERESRALAQLVSLPKIVLATGGGVVGLAKNRKLLAQGLVIYLNADVETQYARTKKDRNRPLLQHDRPKAVLQKLYNERHPLYLSVADMVVPTSHLSPRQMIDDILWRLQERVSC